MSPSPAVFPVNEHMGADHFNMMCSDVTFRYTKILAQGSIPCIRQQMDIAAGRARSHADKHYFQPHDTLTPKSSIKISHFL
jgi:hypothetical protein